MSDDLEQLAAATPVSYATPSRRMARNVPSYHAISVGALVLNVIGGCYVVVGILIIVMSLAGVGGTAAGSDHNAIAFAAFLGMSATFGGVVLISIGCIFLMLASLAVAVRDMARNSWRH